MLPKYTIARSMKACSSRWSSPRVCHLGCYTSEEFYKAEIERIFMRTWNFFGHVDQVKNAGDYIAVDYVGVPIIIVRGRDDVIRAFANSCRHRAAPVAQGEGNAGLFTCPYHSWTYELDGKLRGCPGMEKGQGFRSGRQWPA